MVLSQSKVTSVWSRLFAWNCHLGWLLHLPTGHTVLPSNHPQTGSQFITAFRVLDKYVLQTRRWELRESDQLLIFSGYVLKSPVCSGGHSDYRASSLGSLTTETDCMTKLF